MGNFMKITDEEFFLLAGYIKRKFGINLVPQKKGLVVNRLNKIISSLQLNSIKDYYDYVVHDKTGEADRVLVDAITTNHTFFMREFSHFKYFTSEVLPYWYQHIPDHDLRVWCAACSTGEESYTLAMLIQDFFALRDSSWDTKILATDISQQALAIARQGFYLEEDLANVPEKWRKLYFKKAQEGVWQIIADLQQEVIYRQFNLQTKEFSFKRKFHVIFCRNVMIYFDNDLREALINQFYQWLEPGGYLFIGHSESIDRNKSSFRYVMPAVYRK